MIYMGLMAVGKVHQSTLLVYYTFVSNSKSNNLGICVMCRGIGHLAVCEGYLSDATVAGQ